MPARLFAADVVTVSVEVALPLTEVGLKAAVAPVGRPLRTLSATAPVKPFSCEVEIVYFACWPCTALADDGEATIAKSGAGGGVRAFVTLMRP